MVRTLSDDGGHLISVQYGVVNEKSAYVPSVNQKSCYSNKDLFKLLTTLRKLKLISQESRSN